MCLKISANVLNKLNTIPHDETKHLVSKFFQKIITLKENEHRKHLEISELQVITKKIIKKINLFNKSRFFYIK